MSASRGKILIVDDQYLASEFLRVWAEAYGFEVCATASSAVRALEMAVLHRPDFVLMDVQLDGDDGVEAAASILAQVDTRVIYCTGSNEASTMTRLRDSRPHAILIKPIDPAELGRMLAIV